MKKPERRRGDESGRLMTWPPVRSAADAAAAGRGLHRLDEDRADSMTDEGGPPQSSTRGGRKAAEELPDVGPTRIDDAHARPMIDEVPAPRAPEPSDGGLGRVPAARAATWRWDLATGRLEWDERLEALFGYSDVVTDAGWRENRIHPEDRDRVKASLLRATIASPGAVWSDRYRFRRADGSYASVTERACVVRDEAGPRTVVGAIGPVPEAG